MQILFHGALKTAPYKNMTIQHIYRVFPIANALRSQLNRFQYYYQKKICWIENNKEKEEK